MPKSLIYKEQHSVREEVIEKLQAGEEYDILIIGGGSTGAGCALDAATRGLKVACVERGDFASGTSSRSSKLLHGGIRYLAPAIGKLDLSQWRLVTESLFERETLVRVIMPHFIRPCGIVLPFTSLYKAIEYGVGVLIYRVIAGPSVLPSMRLISAKRVRSMFPVAGRVVGGVMMQDATQDDARGNLMIALTAAAHGAMVANHVEVQGLIKNEEGRLCGAVVMDHETQKTWNIRAKVVVNATGPFADKVRKMDDPVCEMLIEPSSGSHIMLPPRAVHPYCGVGWRNKQKRVAFMIPWQGMALFGTTDHPMPITDSPRTPESDVQYLLEEASRMLQDEDGMPVFERSDITAAWSGIRPLGRSTSEELDAVSRGEVWDRSPSGLLTVSGGKWTTYRLMAEMTIDRAVALGNLTPLRDSCTPRVQLMGGGGGRLWQGEEAKRARVEELMRSHVGLDEDIAEHLVQTYGCMASSVLENARHDSLERLHPDFPFVVADVRQGVKEMARTTVDILARRIRIAYLHHAAAVSMIDRVVQILADELGWSMERCDRERKAAHIFLEQTDPNKTVE